MICLDFLSGKTMIGFEIAQNNMLSIFRIHLLDDNTEEIMLSLSYKASPFDISMNISLENNFDKLIPRYSPFNGFDEGEIDLLQGYVNQEMRGFEVYYIEKEKTYGVIIDSWFDWSHLPNSEQLARGQMGPGGIRIDTDSFFEIENNRVELSWSFIY